VTHIAELLGLEPPVRGESFTTGFTRLDALTDGFVMGSVWLVTGTPGQGCTTLLTQWAARLATEHGLPTWLVTPREDEHHCASRLVSCMGKVRVQQLLRGEASAVDAGRLQVGRAALSRSQLFLKCGPHVTVPAWEENGNRAVVLDDVDLVEGATPSGVRSVADTGALVVASLPRHVLVQDRHPDGDLDPEWARVADVILEVRSRPLAEEHVDNRPGEADFAVLKHRRGPTTTVPVAFQGHYARFVDLRD
jgi:replicative DNA helicase